MSPKSAKINITEDKIRGKQNLGGCFEGEITNNNLKEYTRMLKRNNLMWGDIKFINGTWAFTGTNSSYDCTIVEVDDHDLIKDLRSSLL